MAKLEWRIGADLQIVVGDQMNKAAAVKILRSVAEMVELFYVEREFIPEIPWHKDTFIPEIPWKRDN